MEWIGIIFRKYVNEQESNLSRCLDRFNNALNLVNGTHLRKTKSRRKAKPWMTPHVQAKIRTRNRLQHPIKTNQQERIKACRELKKKVISKVKTDSWKELLEGAMTNTSGKDMWKVINGLNSTPEANSSSESMSHIGCTITDSKAKGSSFINHYARASNLSMTTENQNLIREFKKRIDSPSTANESCFKITMSELAYANRQLKHESPAGPNGIPTIFLNAHGLIILRELLKIFDALFLYADCSKI